MRTPTGSDWAQLILLSMLWGSSFLLMDVALRGLGPAQIVHIRFVVAGLILLPLVWLGGGSLPKKKRQWRSVSVMAILGTVAPFLLLGWAQQFLDSGLAAILLALMPLVTLFLSRIFLRDQQIGPRKVAGFLVALCGVALVVPMEGGPGVSAQQQWLAVGAVLFAATCYASNTIYVRITGVANPISQTSAVMLLSSVLMLPATASDPGAVVSASTESLIAAVILGLMSTALATIIYFRLIQGPGPTFLSIVNYLIPAWAVAMGVVILDEPLTPERIAGMALILSGLALGEWKRRRAPALQAVVVDDESSSVKATS